MAWGEVTRQHAQANMAWYDALPAEQRELYRELDYYVPPDRFLRVVRKAAGNLGTARAMLKVWVAALRRHNVLTCYGETHPQAMA